MTNEQIWEIALRQSAYDCNCRPEDFLSDKHVVTLSKKHELARKYLPLPFECDMVSYGNNIVAQTSEGLVGVVTDYISRYSYAHCFETPNIHVLDDMLRDYGLKVCFMAEYFLPDVNALAELPCTYETRVLHPEDLTELYTDEWSNALCKERKHLDVLGVGAYHDGKLIGLAGCSADCETMYQIGIDVLPEYRRQGIACALTSRLALCILELGKVPFYCAAWCNLRSVRNAVKCGFRPAWAELSARDIAFVDSFNKQLKLR
ncbi:MAG: GNAT family N-acetyltransferase [Clostridia bacterium]|nr:GNAT family N-acetyltransferase [Clostridia bacterium]